MFARINCFKYHPRQNWLNPHIAVVDPNFQDRGPIVFMPTSRIFDHCAVVTVTIKFDYGEDNALAIIKLSNELY